MSTDAPLDILLAHDRWATGQLLAAARSLSDAQLDQRFEMGYGTLRATLLHIVEVQRAWTESLNGRQTETRKDPVSVAEIISRHEAATTELNSTAHATPLDAEFSPAWKGRRYSFPRAGVLTHILTHGMHHRAQALNMLRHLGVDPLPPSSILQWMFMTGVARELPSST